MIVRLGKITAIILTIIGFNSCKNLNVINANKKLHIAGLPNLANYLTYSFTVNSKKPFTVNAIHLTYNDSVIEIEKYSFINLKNATGHTVLKKSKYFEKGDYKFSFRLDVNNNLTDSEFIDLIFKINNAILSKRINVINTGTTTNK